jgi:NAD+ kinase
VKNPTHTIRRIGLVANPEKPRGAALVRRAARLLADRRCDYRCDPATLEMVRGRMPVAPSLDHLARECDVLLVFGGDGTMLRVARDLAGIPVPLLGINAGHLGFLTAVQSGQLGEALDHLTSGRFETEERALLEAQVQRGAERSILTALNDFVLSRGLASRLIELEVTVDRELLTRYRCDGFIACSPTGSTAYSLAAGGAIVSPDAEVMTLTPICPHTLSIRPLVVDLDSVVSVRLLSTRLIATLAADGQQQTDLGAGDTVTIRRSQRSIRLVRLPGTSFFATLRRKFAWSGSNV